MAKAVRNRFLSRKTISRGDATSSIRSLRQRIVNMPLSGVATRWAGYYRNNFPALDIPENWTKKHHAIAKIIREKKPLTLLDMGANRGWYSQLAAHEGVRVIATDNDETSINELAIDVEARNLDVLPLYMDVRFPEAAQGPAYLLFPAAAQRLKSEMVLALAIVHHLVFTWHLKFEQIVDGFAIFTKEWLVLEFIGPNDAVVRRDWNASERPWYTLDNLLVALGKYFVVEAQVPSDSGGLDYRGDDRTVLICKRKAM